MAIEELKSDNFRQFNINIKSRQASKKKQTPASETKP